MFYPQQRLEVKLVLESLKVTGQVIGLRPWLRWAIGLLLTVATVLLYALPLRAETLPPPDPNYLEGVISMYQQVKANPDEPRNRAFHDVLDQLFQPAAVQIPFRFVTGSGAARSVNYAGNIYFSRGAIFITYDSTDGADERFATVDNQLYTWQPGQPAGKILKRFPGDTLAFVMYMIDPSAIMRTMYDHYLAQPNRFNRVLERQGVESILLKQPQNGFKGIQVQTEPFWLRAFMMERPQEKGITVGNLEVDPRSAWMPCPRD